MCLINSLPGISNHLICTCGDNVFLQLSDEVVYDVLCAADLYLLPGLKRLCGLALMHMTDVENVVWKIRTARLFALPRLEAHCAEFIACNLAEVGLQGVFSEGKREMLGKWWAHKILL